MWPLFALAGSGLVISIVLFVLELLYKRLQPQEFVQKSKGYDNNDNKRATAHALIDTVKYFIGWDLTKDEIDKIQP